jgi:hypothetical protein
MILAELTAAEIEELPIIWDILQQKLAAGADILVHWNHWHIDGQPLSERWSPLSALRTNKTEVVVDTRSYDVCMPVDSLPYWKLVKKDDGGFTLYLKLKP